MQPIMQKPEIEYRGTEARYSNDYWHSFFTEKICCQSRDKSDKLQTLKKLPAYLVK